MHTDDMPFDEMLVYHGWQMRDASLDSVEHYFVYNADIHAEMFLG